MLDDDQIKRQDLAIVWLEYQPVNGTEDLTPQQKILYNAMQVRRGDRIFFKRQDLIPSEILPALPHMTILDCIRDQEGQITDYIVRLAGTAVENFYGPITGKAVTTLKLANPKGRSDEVVKLLEETGKPVIASYSFSNKEGPVYDMRMLYIGLRHSQNEPIHQIILHMNAKSRR